MCASGTVALVVKPTGSVDLHMKMSREVYDIMGRLSTGAGLSLSKGIEIALRYYIEEKAGIELAEDRAYVPLP